MKKPPHPAADHDLEADPGSSSSGLTVSDLTVSDLKTVSGLKTAAWLLAAGMVVEIISLGWSHPTAFVLFLGLGGLLVAAGILRFFLAIVPTMNPGSR